ncbi:hypothetical protein CO051_04580 [Candidatus Roizmanbacteria bacterium CG_4_9_14_0_2_um_filter_39_13]|uniref:Yip1 domain-containing protein n=2 Tax=Candidatus Roizmaniibacteriota TaxID=1752723 RepID=A0A2M8EXY1_9BACT|nr:MAG: hypothetical protein COY15_04175 [Candidatus Roizmanbacteria bacterium CG_4_10_14_0_2_um_filter_39_12]PJC31019.1 MAG: hypothetical protein CO051_04580 [Candidatus Roizmanbacteria bacterium CG_4_9_14_0_2_um_filter_39_13]PJE61771.1 MAG: hypothetical protein COU87_02785 [Candidatus Roizmanbacteria bacterium CG10_big_fil_rev_8_21_14_0_10_39_12]
MDFDMISRTSSSVFLFFSRIFRLIFSPYKTMRSIAEDDDVVQLILIIVSIGGYYYIADNLRQYFHHPIVLFGLTTLHFLLTVGFFVFLRMSTKNSSQVKIKPALLLFGYALIPTLVWFLVNSWLFYLLPPPRTISFLGKGFSILYISFSLAILFWKVIVMYLAVRYVTRFTFFRIVYSMVLYLACVIPYSLFLYSLRLFRIPFL